ncbi:TPA: hypothetical protein DCR49_10215 [Candidatus Delongbacteria bacterium]|nr:hypothetical protein [Candidatus Delongbacteria bacterium]
MTQKNIISLFLILHLVIFAMSGDGGNEPKVMKTIGELEGFKVKNVWPDQENSIDSIEYKNIKTEFAEKIRKIGVRNDNLNVIYWDYRINVNKLKALRKLWAYINYFSPIFGDASYAQSVIIGTVKAIKFSSGPLKTTYTVYVEEILTGNDLFKNFPDTVYVKFEDKLDDPNIDICDDGARYHRLDNRYMFFLQRMGLEGHAKYNNLEITDEVNNPNVFMSRTSFDVSNLETYKKYYKRDFKKEFDFDDMKEKIKKIGRLNDKANFFNKSYK